MPNHKASDLVLASRSDNTKDSKNEVTSPCVRSCCLNQADYCLGCKRHLDEITRWRSYSEAQRQVIMEQLVERNINS